MAKVSEPFGTPQSPAPQLDAASRFSLRFLLAHFALLLLVWCAAWSVYLQVLQPMLDDRARGWAYSASAAAGSALDDWYWFCAKCLIWLLPCLLLLGKRRANLLYHLGLRPARLASGLFWGLLASALILALNLGVLALSSSSTVLQGLGSLLQKLSGRMLLAPFTEETLLRGYFLPAQLSTGRLWPSIWINAALFLGLHLPGWIFMRQLGIVEVGRNILSIGLLAALLCWLRVRSDSLLAPLLAHLTNNLAAELH